MAEKTSGYEYLDHTADIQIHSWGPSLKEAFEQAAVAIMGYLTELPLVDIDDARSPAESEAKGEDLESLLYSFLEEVLYLWQTFAEGDYFIFKKVTITELSLGPEFKVKFKAYGEIFDLKKHPQGTEVKAITYSAMQVIPADKNTKKPGVAELYVIIDI